LDLIVCLALRPAGSSLTSLSPTRTLLLFLLHLSVEPQLTLDCEGIILVHLGKFVTFEHFRAGLRSLNTTLLIAFGFLPIQTIGKRYIFVIVSLLFLSYRLYVRRLRL